LDDNDNKESGKRQPAALLDHRKPPVLEIGGLDHQIQEGCQMKQSPDFRINAAHGVSLVSNCETALRCRLWSFDIPILGGCQIRFVQ
jgi:hypothetical protein